MFDGIFVDGMSPVAVFIAMAVSLGCGGIILIAYLIKNNNFTKSYVLTLAIMPVIAFGVAVLINRNASVGIGAGIALGGAFSLVRFRSIPGNARDIVCIYFAMVAGLAAGLGQIYFALIFTGAVCVLFIGMKCIPFEKKKERLERELKITIPEDLDFQAEFESIFATYLKSVQMTRIKTSKMGTLYVLTYLIQLKASNTEKALMDELRVKNGNLPINCYTIVNKIVLERL